MKSDANLTLIHTIIIVIIILTIILIHLIMRHTALEESKEGTKEKSNKNNKTIPNYTLSKPVRTGIRRRKSFPRV